MHYKEIRVKSILNKVKETDNLFGLFYDMNLYRGCEHQCIYCDTRSECYRIENFQNEILVKINGIDILQRTLSKKQIIGTIGFGSMNDPYTIAEVKYGLTAKALEVLAAQKWPVHLMTKSDLVLKDLQLLEIIRQIWAQVSFSITTADDELASKIEPGAPPPSRRFKAMQILSDAGIYTGVILMPMLPFITDSQFNLTSIIEKAHKNKAAYIIPSFGMTLRDRQKEYYFNKLDELFPGTKRKYESSFKNAYYTESPNRGLLENILKNLCEKYGIATRINQFMPRTSVQQLRLFE